MDSRKSPRLLQQTQCAGGGNRSHPRPVDSAVNPCYSDLESQSDVFVPAFRTAAQLRAKRRRIQRIAADAVKGRFAPFEFEAPVIPTVIPQPQTEKHGGNEHTINHSGGPEVEHRGQYASSVGAGEAQNRATKKKHAVGPLHGAKNNAEECCHSPARLPSGLVEVMGARRLRPCRRRSWHWHR
jgi:hypothetical protein